MRVLIIEDEDFAAKRIRKLVAQLLPEAEILPLIDAVQEAIMWFKKNEHPDLLFLDIELSDGSSFSFLEEIRPDCPIIFTTAYNEFALKAFEYSSIDYLLKPIEFEALKRAVNKWEKWNQRDAPSWKKEQVSELLKQIRGEYRKRFLVKVGEQYIYILVEEVAYFKSEDGETLLCTKKGKRFIVSQKLDLLSKELDPDAFYRINRKFILQINSIEKIVSWFSGRLKIDVQPDPKEELIVSRERVAGFRLWLDQ